MQPKQPNQVGSLEFLCSVYSSSASFFRGSSKLRDFISTWSLLIVASNIIVNSYIKFNVYKSQIQIRTATYVNLEIFLSSSLLKGTVRVINRYMPYTNAKV